MAVLSSDTGNGELLLEILHLPQPAKAVKHKRQAGGGLGVRARGGSVATPGSYPLLN